MSEQEQRQGRDKGQDKGRAVLYDREGDGPVCYVRPLVAAESGPGWYLGGETVQTIPPEWTVADPAAVPEHGVPGGVGEPASWYRDSNGNLYGVTPLEPEPPAGAGNGGAHV